MQTRQRRTAAVNSVVHLAQQIRVVLTGQTCHTFLGAFGVRAVTRLALRRINAASLLDVFTAADAAGFRPRHFAHVRCDIGDVLWTFEMMLLGSAFHAEVPALARAEVDQLFGERSKVLPGNTWRGTFCDTAAVRAMARGAMSEKRFAVDWIGVRAQRIGEFPLRGGGGSRE